MISYKIQDTLTDEQFRYLEMKYQNSFISKAFLSESYTSQNIQLHFFCAFSEQEQLDEILVFYLSGKTAVVINWLVEVDPNLVEGFVNAVFASFSHIKRIEWQRTVNAINTRHSFSYVENSDMCIALPSTRERYNEMLSSNSRKIYVNKTHRVERDLDAMIIDQPVNESNIYMIDVLAEWKQNQMEQRGEKSKVIPDRVKNVVEQIGSLSYIKDKQQVVCICVFYKTGSHVFLEQTAYKEGYSRYSLGRVLLYQSILHFIDQGATHFHFLWKGADYKKHYSAQEIIVFNSYSYRRPSFQMYIDRLKKMVRLELRRIANTPRGHQLRQWVNKRLHGRTI